MWTKFKEYLAATEPKAKPLVIPFTTSALALLAAYFYGKSKANVQVVVQGSEPSSYKIYQ
jgi:hypothetical protein